MYMQLQLIFLVMHMYAPCIYILVFTLFYLRSKETVFIKIHTLYHGVDPRGFIGCSHHDSEFWNVNLSDCGISIFLYTSMGHHNDPSVMTQYLIVWLNQLRIPKGSIPCVYMQYAMNRLSGAAAISHAIQYYIITQTQSITPPPSGPRVINNV